MRATTFVLSGLLVINLAITAMLYYKYYPGADADDSAGDVVTNSASNSAGETGDKSTRNFNPEQYGPVYATVNDLPVRQLELLPYVGEIMPAAQFQSLKRFDEISDNYLSKAMQSIAIDELLDNEARNHGLYADPGIQSAIRQYERRYMRAAYLNAITPTLVTDEDVKSVYDKLTADLTGKTEYRARHILLASEQEARVVSEALAQKKKTFAELAILYSIDDATSFNGGDLGFNIEGQLQAQFEAVVTKLPLKQYSRPFKTDLGWHIAVVDERRASKPLLYEQAAPAIRTNLEQQAMNAYVEEMLSSANISVNAFDVDTDAMATESVPGE
jgi:peptidyl-prolyl cis-trans isomerase C